MSAYIIYWTPFALNCVDEIFEYINSQAKSVIPAQKFVQSIFEKTDQLKQHPYSGQIEPLLIKTLQKSRYLLIGEYKIIYQVKEKSVFITDVFHVKQNPSKIKKRNR